MGWGGGMHERGGGGGGREGGGIKPTLNYNGASLMITI